MRNIPSKNRTRKILEICDSMDLIEPFRLLHPTKQEFTFIPSGLNEQNRSRLDFFLLSESLFNTYTSVKIPNNLTSTFFDHKPVFLEIKRLPYVNKNLIKDFILRNIDLPSHVRAAVYEAYLHHWEPGRNLDGTTETKETINERLLIIGRIYKLLSEIKALELNSAINGECALDELNIAAKRGEINLLFDDLPVLSYFENLHCNSTPDVFFTTLVNGIKNNVLSHQAYVSSLKNKRKILLNKEICTLKRNYLRNCGEILR
jgi:hypothetical protein